MSPLVSLSVVGAGSLEQIGHFASDYFSDVFEDREGALCGVAA